MWKANLDNFCSVYSFIIQRMISCKLANEMFLTHSILFCGLVSGYRPISKLFICLSHFHSFFVEKRNFRIWNRMSPPLIAYLTTFLRATAFARIFNTHERKIWNSALQTSFDAGLDSKLRTKKMKILPDTSCPDLYALYMTKKPLEKATSELFYIFTFFQKLFSVHFFPRQQGAFYRK